MWAIPRASRSSTSSSPAAAGAGCCASISTSPRALPTRDCETGLAAGGNDSGRGGRDARRAATRWRSVLPASSGKLNRPQDFERFLGQEGEDSTAGTAGEQPLLGGRTGGILRWSVDPGAVARQEGRFRIRADPEGEPQVRVVIPGQDGKRERFGNDLSVHRDTEQGEGHRSADRARRGQGRHAGRRAQALPYRGGNDRGPGYGRLARSRSTPCARSWRPSRTPAPR